MSRTPRSIYRRKTAMKLPTKCRFQFMTAADFNQDGIECSDCCRSVGPYWLTGSDKPLCRSQQEESEAYRFFWRSSFRGDASIWIGRRVGSIALRWKYRRLAVAGQQEAASALSMADWGRLQDAMESARYWSLNSTRDDAGFDGAQWLVEGRRKDAYHAVHRWSPRGAFHDLGRLFFALAGPPLAEVDLT